MKPGKKGHCVCSALSCFDWLTLRRAQGDTWGLSGEGGDLEVGFVALLEAGILTQRPNFV